MTGTAHSLEAVVHGLPPAVDDPPLIEGGACTQQHSRNGTSQFPYASWVSHHGTVPSEMAQTALLSSGCSSGYNNCVSQLEPLQRASPEASGSSSIPPQGKSTRICNAVAHAPLHPPWDPPVPAGSNQVRGAACATQIKSQAAFMLLAAVLTPYIRCLHCLSLLHTTTTDLGVAVLLFWWCLPAHSVAAAVPCVLLCSAACTAATRPCRARPWRS